MRTVGSSREATWPAIRKAGIKLLYRHGFEAMNLRELATEAGLKGAGSLYNYFGSKEDFLFRIMCEIMDEILVELEDNCRAGRRSCIARRAFVEFHIRWHTGRREETFISHMEMRSLPPERYRHYVGLRKQLRSVRDEDHRRPAARAATLPSATRTSLTQSILSMLTSDLQLVSRRRARQPEAPDRDASADGAGDAAIGRTESRMRERRRPKLHPRVHAAVDDQRHAGDIARPFRRQERDRLGDVAGRRTAQRHALALLLPDLLD